MDKNRPIVWMIDSLGPGGAEQLLPTILKRLKDAGFNIRICALQCRLGNPIASELERIGLPVDLVPIPNLRHPLNLFRILYYLRTHRPIIVHTQLEFANVLGTIAAKILGIPTVATLHTLDTFAERKFSLWRLRLRWFVLRIFCDQIIAVSEKTRTYHVQSGKLNSDKVITLYNGVDISRFQNINESQKMKIRQTFNLPLDNPIIITVAVLRELKGVQNMIRALPSIFEQFPNAQYLIVGDGAYGASLRDLASTLGIQDRVTFAGHRTDIPALLACSDLFVLPTLKDALPTVLIEALAAEKPVIASAVDGVPEIIENGVNGLLVPPDDPSSLAKACLQIMKNKEQTKQLILAGSEIVQQRFSIIIQIEKLSKVYEELTTSHGKQK